jgi:hypothetical protein
VEDLARIETEKNHIETERDQEKTAYEEKLFILRKKQGLLLKEKIALEDNLKESKKTLKTLQEKSKLFAKEQEKPVTSLQYTSPYDLNPLRPLAMGHEYPHINKNKDGNLNISGYNLHYPQLPSLVSSREGYSTNMPSSHPPTSSHLPFPATTTIVTCSNHHQPSRSLHYNPANVSITSNSTWCSLHERADENTLKDRVGAQPVSCSNSLTTETKATLVKRDASIQTASYETIATQTDDNTIMPKGPVVRKKASVKSPVSGTLKQKYSEMRQNEEEREEDIVSALLNKQPFVVDLITHKSMAVDDDNAAIGESEETEEELLRDLFFI